MSEKKILRCAIYTRKSTEEGLDMDYNTLDAQREAGEKYIEAMRGEGWRIIPDLYDDGGYSGGNMDRPALKRLMDDIKGGRIDIVVVYKVDRLSRSLADFAKLVEIFDAHDTSFVSVTQHFNTKDSMGRLTLNILLSFAQFEREVTGERIRDKFAASKKKGMWMGGPPPLGYDVADRKLVTNPTEAKLVCHIFKRFIALGSVALLAAELNKDGYTTKSYVSRAQKQVGGRNFTINPLISMLKNRLYVGDVHHKGQYYPGQHTALISHDIFAQAQAIFNENKHEKRKRTWTIKSKALLKGIIYCGSCGGAMSPTHTRKKNKHYHYYVANSYRKQMCDDCPVNPNAMMTARQQMNDFQLIITSEDTFFRPEDSILLHNLFKTKLIRWFEENRDKPKVVISHHAPVINLNTRYRASPLQPAFNSLDMIEVIEKYQPNLWVYGHTHECDDQMLASTRIISNQRGYPNSRMGFECEGFDPSGVLIEIGD